MGEDRTEPYTRRLTAKAAAEQLGVSTEAIRGRIRRKTIRHERVGGRVYVLLPADRSAEQTGDQSEIVEELRRQNEYLREENRRKDAILLNMTEAMKALSPPAQETPRDEREAPETAEEAPDRAEPRPDAPGPQEGAQKPWWRRAFRR